MTRLKRYTFLSRPEVQEGKAGFCFALISFAAFLAAVIISFISSGEAWGIVGALGFIGFCFSIYGFYQGLHALKEKDVSYRLSIIGSVAGGLMIIVWVAVLFLGMK